MTFAKGKLLSVYQNWINTRTKLSAQIILTQKNIYIFPNKTGLLFFTLIVLMFVNGINYQNNLIFTLSALLFSLFFTAIVATYQNMSGLIIRSAQCHNVFSGQALSLKLIFEHNKKQPKEGFYLGFSRQESIALTHIESVAHIQLPFVPKQRGYLKVPKITLFTSYPLGLLTSWTWLRLDFKALVYPKVITVPFQYVSGTTDARQKRHKKVSAGVDDFVGFKNYQTGDSLKNIAWRHYAKSDVLLSKEFNQPMGEDHMLDWHATHGDVERRLSILCGWVLRSHEENRRYGLSLPAQKVAPSKGESHKDACLKVLALYGQEKTEKALQPI